MYFDARAAKQLKPGEHLAVEGCQGLRMVASTTRKAWVYRYKEPVSGLMKQVKIGAWPAMSVAEAAAAWQALRARRDAGEDLRAAKRKVPAAPGPVHGYTLKQLVEDYAAGHLARRRAAKGAHAITQRLRKAVAEHAEVPVEAISRRFVFELVERLADRPVLAASVKTELAAAWDYALDAGRISDALPNWWRLVAARQLRSLGAMRAGERKGTAKRVLSEGEVATLLNADFARFSQQVRDFLTIQLWTCTRGAEIVQMHRTQITQEADGWWWTVPKALTKGRHLAGASDLRVPLVGRALEIVQRLCAAQSGWLFPSVSRRGEVGHQQQAYMQSKTHYLQPYSRSRPDHVRERLSVTHWSPHDLRRTGRTMLAAMGCPNEVGEAILGHFQPGVVGIYNRYRYDKERRHWLTLLSERLELVASSRPCLAAVADR